MDRPPGGLLTSTAGSYARPSWLFAGLTAAERGELGPADVAELLDDAVDLAIREQEAAGIDILTDGEMRRAGFFTAAFYGHLTGVAAAAARVAWWARRATTSSTASRSSSRSPRRPGLASWRSTRMPVRGPRSPSR